MSDPRQLSPSPVGKAPGVAESIRSQEYFLRFLLSTGSLLVLVLALSWYHFPRESPPIELMSNEPGAQAKQRSLWDRLFNPDRNPRPQRGSQSRTSVQGMGSVPMNSIARTDISMTSDQLALRETALAQVILMDRFGSSEQAGWNALKRTKVETEFRHFEEQRFLAEVLLMRYQHEIGGDATLPELRRTMAYLAKSQAACFEDRYGAGAVALLSGEPHKARALLEQAWDEWPASGRAKGNVYLYLMVTFAVLKESDRALFLLADFQLHFPDWLYLETYIPDLREFETVYPNEPLLPVIRGRMRHYVYDYAAANALYRQALASDELAPRARRIVTDWAAETAGSDHP